jgi:hypothetical protein
MSSSVSPNYDPCELAVQAPPELLVEIFEMCSPLGEDDFGLSDKTTPVQEVERLAKRYLLQLSQVHVQLTMLRSIN